MSEVINMNLTNKGVLLKNKMELGDGTLPLEITRIVGGAGTSDAPLEQTDVMDIRQTFDLASRLIEDGRTAISAILTNINLDTSYEMWQIGFYAMDPDEGEILYRISQFPQPVYVPSNSLSAWTYTPVFCFSTHNASDVVLNINPAGVALKSEVDEAIRKANEAMEIVSDFADTEQITEDIQRAQDTADEALGIAQSAVEAISNISTSVILTGTLSIPAASWQAGNNGKYKYYADYAIDGITGANTGLIDPDDASLDIAIYAGMRPRADTMAGKLRLWCEEKPADAISGEYTIFGASGGVGGSTGGGNYVLPVATATTLGGIKAPEGFIKPDGTLTGKPGDELMMTDDMVDQIIDEIKNGN